MFRSGRAPSLTAPDKPHKSTNPARLKKSFKSSGYEKKPDGRLTGVAGDVTLLFGRRTGLSKLSKRGIRIRFRGFLTEYLQSVISNAYPPARRISRKARPARTRRLRRCAVPCGRTRRARPPESPPIGW